MTSPDQRPPLSKTSINQVFPEPTVGALIVNNQGKILLAKSHKWFDKYTLPGGHIEVGESMTDAVKREVKEEVGLEVDVVDMLLIQEAIFAPEFYKKKHFIFIDFYCKSKDQQVKLDQNEIHDYVWVYPGAAYNLKLDSFTMKTLDTYLKRGYGSVPSGGLGSSLSTLTYSPTRQANSSSRRRFLVKNRFNARTRFAPRPSVFQASFLP